MKYVYGPRVDPIRDPRAFFAQHGQSHVPLARHHYFFVRDISVNAACDLACQPGFISTPVWLRDLAYVVPSFLHDDVRAALRYKEVCLGSSTADKLSNLETLRRTPGYEGVTAENLGRGFSWLDPIEAAHRAYARTLFPSLLPQCRAIGMFFLADVHAIRDFVPSEKSGWELVVVAGYLKLWLETEGLV